MSDEAIVIIFMVIGGFSFLCYLIYLASKSDNNNNHKCSKCNGKNCSKRNNQHSWVSKIKYH